MPAIAYDPFHMDREEAFLRGLPPVAHKVAFHLIRALREAEGHRVEDNELKLAARCAMPLSQVRQAREWLLIKFRLEGGFWSCPLVDEMAAAIEQKRRAGSIGGRNRAENERRSRRGRGSWRRRWPPTTSTGRRSSVCCGRMRTGRGGRCGGRGGWA